jgi:hypothetical protein
MFFDRIGWEASSGVWYTVVQPLLNPVVPQPAQQLQVELTYLDLSNNRIGPNCRFSVPPALSTLLLNDNLCAGPHPSATSLTTVDLAFTGGLADVPSTLLQTLRVDRGNRFTQKQR